MTKKEAKKIINNDGELELHPVFIQTNWGDDNIKEYSVIIMNEFKYKEDAVKFETALKTLLK
jgi:hypothetical protein